MVRRLSEGCGGANAQAKRQCKGAKSKRASQHGAIIPTLMRVKLDPLQASGARCSCISLDICGLRS
jgi:hypothetical protein